MFVGQVQLRKIESQPEQEMHCGQTLQSALVTKKLNKKSENTLRNEFYIILRLCNIQLKIIVFEYLLMETKKINAKVVIVILFTINL